VICDPAIQLEVGEKVQVSTDGGWFTACVVRVGITPQGRVVGLERQFETPATTQARKDESRLVAVVFGIAVVLMPLLTLAWTRLGPNRPRASKSAPQAQIAAPDATSHGFRPPPQP
jgi:hypothetical protein